MNHSLINAILNKYNIGTQLYEVGECFYVTNTRSISITTITELEVVGCTGIGCSDVGDLIIFFGELNTANY